MAPGAAAINAVVAAAHQAVDALVHVAMTDTETVKIAERAGRLYVSMRSLSGDDKPRPFTTAPTARCRAMHDVYRAALDASIEATQELDVIALSIRGPSMALALARAAASDQSHRRIWLDIDELHDPPLAEATYFQRQPRIYRRGRVPGTSHHRPPGFRPGYPAPRHGNR